jgi:catalase
MRRPAPTGIDWVLPHLTTNHGVPISDNQNSLKAGSRGPTLLEDFHFREKIFHFDHERIPERVVHARGYAAHGFFELRFTGQAYPRRSVSARRRANPRLRSILDGRGQQGLGRHSRDVRGFAVKIYTQEGNWDLVGNNIPVFFIQDAIKFPDLVHAVKEEPTAPSLRRSRRMTTSGTSFR